MGMKNITRRFAAWLACFAILFAALAPTVSHALELRSNPASPWAEVCGADGLKLSKPADDAGSRSPSNAGLHLEHCPFCYTHAGTFGLPPSASLILPVAAGKAIAPALFYQSPRPLFIWNTAQSRAPPSLS